MTDVPPNGAQALPVSTHTPFPVIRLLYAVGFALLAWLGLWALIVLGAVQFVFFAINGRVNDEIKHVSLRLVQYLVEVLAFITFVKDEPPFPIGPLPKKAEQSQG